MTAASGVWWVFVVAMFWICGFAVQILVDFWVGWGGFGFDLTFDCWHCDGLVIFGDFAAVFAFAWGWYNTDSWRFLGWVGGGFVLGCGF